MTMRRILLVSLLLLAGSPSWAMEHFSNVAQDQNGRAIVGATITIYNANTTTLSQIYSDNGVTLKSNPFTTGLDGVYDFYAADGLYDIKITKTGYPATYWDATKLKGMALFDPINVAGKAIILNNQTGTSYTIANDDRGKFISVCSAVDSTVSLPVAGSSYTAGWYVYVSNRCAGAVTIEIGLGSELDDGLTELALTTNQSALLVSDGSNYFSFRGSSGGSSSSSGLDANFDILNGNSMTGSSETKRLELYGTGAQANNGGVWYQHSSGEWVENCIVGGVEGACDKYVKLNAGKKWGIKDSGGNIDLEVTESTGKVSAMTVDAEDVNVNLTLYHKLCGGDLVGVDPATGAAGHIWNKSPLGTAPTATAVTGTNRTIGVATFPDTDGDYGVQLTCYLPNGFTGAIDGLIWWKTTGTGNARFQFATKCYADDEADDAAFNTASILTAAAGTSGRPNRDVLLNITSTGCAGTELLRLRFFRNRTEASDTLNAALEVERVELWGRRTY